MGGIAGVEGRGPGKDAMSLTVNRLLTHRKDGSPSLAASQGGGTAQLQVWGTTMLSKALNVVPFLPSVPFRSLHFGVLTFYTALGRQARPPPPLRGRCLPAFGTRVLWPSAQALLAICPPPSLVQGYVLGSVSSVPWDASRQPPRVESASP